MFENELIREIRKKRFIEENANMIGIISIVVVIALLGIVGSAIYFGWFMLLLKILIGLFLVWNLFKIVVKVIVALLA